MLNAADHQSAWCVFPARQRRLPTAVSSFYISARLQRGRIEVACMQCIRACLQACRRNALSPGFSRRCCPPCQAGKTTFGEPVPPDLYPVATLLLRALREPTLDELHGSFSRTQDIFSRPPLPARARPSQRLKPIPFRNGSARLKACPDTKPVIAKRAPKCRNSRRRLPTAVQDAILPHTISKIDLFWTHCL